MDQQANLPPWLKSLLQAKFYEQCESHTDYDCKFFCRDCMIPTICERCVYKTEKHIDHNVLQVFKASGQPGLKIHIIKKLLDISNIQHFIINGDHIVYIKQRGGHVIHANGELECRTSDKYCSIECKIRRETSLMEEPDVPRVTNVTNASRNTKRTYVQPPHSFRKRSRKGFPIRSHLF